MFDYFKNIADKNSCRSNGVCSVHPSVNSLYQIILSEIREISFYLVKLKEFKLDDFEAEKVSIEGLSIFLINTSFNQIKYLNFVRKLNTIKKRVKDTYTTYCMQNEFPCETINTNFEIKDNTTISELIEYAQNNIANKQKNSDKTKQRLFEVITIFARLCSIEVVKIKKLEKNFNKFDFEVLRFFALTNGYSIRNEKIIRRIVEFSSTSLSIRNKLSDICQERYGTKESANPSLSEQKGHCILVSGDDLDELEALLNTLEEAEQKEPVNVYTNGALFLAHFYPYFKNNKYLKGHWGSDNAEYDFSVFPGSILITQNFIQKIDSLYRGEIFSNKLISFSKVFDIEGDNYMPVIEQSLQLEGFSAPKEKKALKINYDRKEIENFIDNFKNEEVIIISGAMDDKNNIEDLENKKIINLSCPLESDILTRAIEKLKEKDAKITLFFAQCNLASLNMVLSLLNQNISLHLANCPHALINPHVVESLEKDFNVNII